MARAGLLDCALAKCGVKIGTDATEAAAVDFFAPGRRGARVPARAMLKKAIILWVAGLLTIVPYSVYYLLYEAQRSEYALWICVVLFWIFGYWSIAGPLLGALKVRTVFRTLERARSKDELLATFRSPEGRDVAIDLIMKDSHIPRFLATRVYTLIVRRFAADVDSAATVPVPAADIQKE